MPRVRREGQSSLPSLEAVKALGEPSAWEFHVSQKLQARERTRRRRARLSMSRSAPLARLCVSVCVWLSVLPGGCGARGSEAKPRPCASA